MSLVTTVNDHENAFLSRREITCDFAGLGGKLKKMEAVEMVTKQYGLDGKVVIPIALRNQVGRTNVSGTFYVYDDEALARKHVSPIIFERLERLNKQEDE